MGAEFRAPDSGDLRRRLEGVGRRLGAREAGRCGALAEARDRGAALGDFFERFLEEAATP